MYWHLEFQFFLFFSLRLFSSALNVCLSLTFDVADNYLLERWQSSSRSVLLARYRTYLQVFTFAVAMKYSACDTVRIFFFFFLFLTWFPYSFLLLLLPNIDILSTEYWREWIFITKRVLSWRKTEFWLFITKCLEARRETNSRSLDFKDNNAWSYYFDWCNMNKGS